MHSAKCSHDPGATIMTAPEEAVSYMQLQLHSLPVKKWRKRKSVGGNRHLQDAKKHARQILLHEVAGGGLANHRYRGATCFRPLLHPFSRVLARNGVCVKGTETRPDYLANRVDQKMRVTCEKIAPKSRNSRR